MTATDPEASRRDEVADCRVHLSESPDGWVLTLVLPTDAARYVGRLVREGRRSLRPGQVSVSISPNLVPGEPFDLAAVHVELREGRRP